MAADTESGAYELDAAAVQATVDCYNELCAKGCDDDFGVAGSDMAAIDTPPFFCIKGDVGMSGINAGVMVDNRYRVIDTEGAPIPGLYAAGIQAGNPIYVSGQIPIDPATGEFAGQDIKTQTRQSLTNISNILAAAGASMADVVKTTVLLNDIADFAAMNEVYAEFFTEPYPARAAFQAAGIPKGALVEIECVAVKG